MVCVLRAGEYGLKHITFKNRPWFLSIAKYLLLQKTKTPICDQSFSFKIDFD